MEALTNKQQVLGHGYWVMGHGSAFALSDKIQVMGNRL